MPNKKTVRCKAQPFESLVYGTLRCSCENLLHQKQQQQQQQKTRQNNKTKNTKHSKNCITRFWELVFLTDFFFGTNSVSMAVKYGGFYQNNCFKKD